MTDNMLMLSSQGNVDVQVGGSGNPWKYLSSCAWMDGPSVPRGGTELRYCQDAERAGKFRVSSKIRRAADQASGNLMTKLSKVNFLEGLECAFSLRARFATCGQREDPSNYSDLMLTFCDVDLTSEDFTDLVAMSAGDDDEITVTSPWTASQFYRLKSVSAGRIGGGAANVGDQPINDIVYCDSASCGGECGDRSDGCSVFYGVTDPDVSPYAYPNLIKGVKDLTSKAWTYTLAPIIGIAGAVNAIECAGDRLVVASNADSVVAYNDHDGDQDEWNVITLANAPAATPNSLFARTPRELWVACTGGYVYRSADGGASYSALHEGALTAEQLNAIYAFDEDLVYAVGDNGVILKSEDGGETWLDMTEVATTAANLLAVVVPPGRPKEVFIGTNSGQIFRSTDEGVTFSEYAFAGSGVGTIDDLKFCGPCSGDVLWILHNDAGPRGRVLRDLSGGYGGSDVEEVVGYTEIPGIAAGIELNALDCCSVNEALVGGELNGGYPMILRMD